MTGIFNFKIIDILWRYDSFMVLITKYHRGITTIFFRLRGGQNYKIRDMTLSNDAIFFPPTLLQINIKIIKSEGTVFMISTNKIFFHLNGRNVYTF